MSEHASGGRRSVAVPDPAPGHGRMPERLARFIARHGWRAYALPALTLLATVALAVLTISPPQASQAETTGGGPLAAPAPSTSAPASAAPSSAVPPAPPPYVEAGDGTLSIVPGQGEVLGSGGPVVTFDVEIEGGTGADGTQFAAAVEQILSDPRGWGAGGAMRFQRVSDDSAELHVALVSPSHVEGFCPGYNTEGYTSCRYGDRVVINLARWTVGVPDYEGRLEEYRQYVVSHEVGHYLGHEHVSCPAPGGRAPVMLQQTLGLEGCVPNPWPYPDGPGGDPDAPA